MTVIARLVKVKMFYEFDKGNANTYTCGSIEGAKAFVKREIERYGEKVEAYAIEEQEYIPCNENDPKGQLYIVIGYHEFVELN